jgi:hypothetical protein
LVLPFDIAGHKGHGLIGILQFDFYCFKGIHEGEIVQEMTTDENGHAETPKEIANALELGTYYVTETKASANSKRVSS